MQLAIYGYHRTSTREQHLDRGIAEITDFCVAAGYSLTEIYTDQQTGKHFNRPEWNFLYKRLLAGDMLVISEVDRLGRNKDDILKILRELKERKVQVVILEIPTTHINFAGMDSSVATLLSETISNMLIEMFAVFAQAEMEKRVKRQQEGIEQKKQRGEWGDYGRPKKVAMEQFAPLYEQVQAGKLRPCDCIRQLGISRSGYYRYERELQSYT